MQMKPLHIGVIVLLFLTWVVLLSGVAAYHDEIDASMKDLRAQWWGVWFAFFVCILNVVAFAMGAHKWCVALVSFAAMVSAYLMPFAEAWIVLEDNSTGDVNDIAHVCAAGTCSFIAVNWVLILLAGNSAFRGAPLPKAFSNEVVP